MNAVFHEESSEIQKSDTAWIPLTILNHQLGRVLGESDFWISDDSSWKTAYMTKFSKIRFAIEAFYSIIY